MRQCVFLFLWFLSTAQSAEMDQTIDAWLAHQTNVQTWAATFTQTRTLKALAQPLVSTGRVWFAAPQNFRWELGRDQTIAIRSNETMLVIYPRLKRAEKYDFDKTDRSEWKDALGLLQSGFPRSRAELDRQFEVLGVEERNALIALQLQPRSPGARRMMPRINLFLSTNFTLAGTELVFADGSRMRNDFENTTTNVDVAGKFTIETPPGFKLIEPMKAPRK